MHCLYLWEVPCKHRPNQLIGLLQLLGGDVCPERRLINLSDVQRRDLPAVRGPVSLWRLPGGLPPDRLRHALLHGLRGGPIPVQYRGHSLQFMPDRPILVRTSKLGLWYMLHGKVFC